jgi:hypothetical protein
VITGIPKFALREPLELIASGTKIAVAVAVAVASLAVAASVAHAGQQTTGPGLVYTEPTVMTDRTITLTRTRIPRGVIIRYAIVNRGTRPYAVHIWDTSTAPIPPNGRVVLPVNWRNRGRYVYRIFYHGKPAGPRRYITVF